MNSTTPPGLIDAGSSATPDELGRALAAHAAEYGYALQRGCELERSTFADLVTAIGELSSHRFGTGGPGFLDLDASPDADKVVTGQSALPLHTDGTLVDASPRFIVLYCREFEQGPGSGRTELCLQREVVESASSAHQRILHGDWEYFVTDESHFPDVANRWIRIPATVDGHRGRRLNLAMPFADAGTAGWQVRLPDVSAEESRDALSSLDRHMRSVPSFYSHAWTTGDVLVIDNDLVLHGRTAIDPGGRRLLLRGQVNA